jgi:undecaprenyl-diphosphatase
MRGPGRMVSAVRARDRRPAARLIAWGPGRLRRAGAGVEEAAEHTKLWWAAAVTMAGGGGAAEPLPPGWPR